MHPYLFNELARADRQSDLRRAHSAHASYRARLVAAPRSRRLPRLRALAFGDAVVPRAAGGAKRRPAALNPRA